MQSFNAGKARATAIQRWAALPKPSGRAAWVARAAEASSILKIDANERDVEGKTPYAEIQMLKEARLVNLLGPREFGGGSETWETSYKITTKVAKADGSIGHLLGIITLGKTRIRGVRKNKD